MADWQKIKTEYITTDISLRKLAEKYEVRYATVQDRAKREEWITMRDRHRTSTVSKTISKIGNKQADKMARIEGITDKLLSKLEKAVEELDIHLATHTRKEKVIQYDNSLRPDKPTKEIITETEQILQVESIIDRAGIRQLTAALKDLKEIQMLKSELDRQEQEARIAKLQREAQEDTVKEPIRVIIDDGLNDYCK